MHKGTKTIAVERTFILRKLLSTRLVASTLLTEGLWWRALPSLTDLCANQGLTELRDG